VNRWLNAVCVLSLAAGLAQAGEDGLRKAWTRQPERARVLAEAAARLANLAERWPAHGQSPRNLAADPDLRWLLDHPVPAYLTLDSVLSSGPTGARRSAALYVAGRLHWRPLGKYLPGLLAASATKEQKLEVLQCMAALRDPASLKALEAFLRAAPKGTDQELLMAALRGIGLTGQRRYAPLIRQTAARLSSPAAQFAACRLALICGDADALGRCAQFLKVKDSRLQAEVIRFLGQNFNDQTMTALAQFAAEQADQALSVTAIRAIIQGSGCAEPAPGGEPAEKEETAGEPEAPPPPPGPPEAAVDWLPQDLSKASPAERRKAVADLLLWWEREGRAQFEQRRTAQPADQ